MAKFGKWEYSEEELERQITEATARGSQSQATEPRARAAAYDRQSQRLIIELKNGVTLLVPVELVQGVAGATAELIEEVEITPSGYGLHWERLDADVSVPGLVAGIFGTQAWMSEIGRRGGRASTPAKSVAARANGKKGGRPRKMVAS